MLSRYSAADTAPVHFILTGTPQEQPLLEAIAQATTAPITMMTGMTTGQLAALLQRVRLVLGVDSGPLHLAVAMRTPTVRIYGPIDPCIFGPWGSPEQHAVVLSTHRCSHLCGHPLWTPILPLGTGRSSLCLARPRARGAHAGTVVYRSQGEEQ